MSETNPVAGKICLVTGSTSGIGAVTAEMLAKLGARVVIVGRDAQKTLKVAERIRAKARDGVVDYLLADLSSLEEIRSLVADFDSRYPRLDVLVNNAGGYFLKRIETVDGFEMTFALNYLGSFLLTNLLLVKLKESDSARVVNVASSAHERGRINFDDLQNQVNYQGFEAYAQSKLALVLFTRELAHRLTNTEITVNALHPGLVSSNFGRNNGWTRFMVRRLLRKQISPEEGAGEVAHLAVSPEAGSVSGRYFVDSCETSFSGLSSDKCLARRLWQVSTELVGDP